MLLGEEPRRISANEGPAIARRLRERGPRSVILKLGDQGCVYVDESREIYSAGFKVEARDTTAAGDVFNGALAAALVEGNTLDDALRFANAAAGISVSRVGAQASVPSRGEVDQFLKR
jgi:ribokinase